MIKMTTKLMLRIAVRSPLRKTFDYLALKPNTWQPGQRLIVPFGRRDVVGVLIETTTQSNIPMTKLKTIHRILDPVSLLPPPLMSLFQWASYYYHHPIGEVILNSFPKQLRQGKAPIHCENHPLTKESIKIIQDPLPLNAAQSNAVQALSTIQGFQCFCLQGVTGSGKTEVYLQSMASRIKAGQQVLILIPEIGLTPQTASRFEKRFGLPVTCLHSKLTDKQRLTAWLQAQSGQAQIIIGTRSAIFVPLKNLSMIIIDESHDLSFKQHSGFRYSAKDVAIMRAKIEKVPIVLGSATPSLESLVNVKQGRFQQLLLPNRIEVAKPPKITLINLQHQKLKAGLSNCAIQSIQNHLAQKKQVFIFLNRRGYAPILLCHHCRWAAPCQQCDARMTLHQSPPRLYCHHCGAQQKVPVHCPHCRQSTLSHIGVGTEQLETTLISLFPKETIVRIDRDSTRKKNSLEHKLKQIHSGEARLLIGTQMVSKGHHFPHLSLVIIIDGDSGLYGTDFRSMERMGQLLIQVSGRAGRETQPGEVLFQTHHPEHPLLQLLLKQKYTPFTEALLNERKIAALPPFAYLALLRANAKKSEIALDFLHTIKNNALANTTDLKADTLGPLPAPMERRGGRYHAQLLIQSKNRLVLHQTARQLIQQCENTPMHRKVRWSIDIDPQDLF